MSMSSDAFVAALCRTGFVIYHKGPEGTILERGTRAVVVPSREWLEADEVGDLRRMAGITWREFDAMIAQPESELRAYGSATREQASAG
ncbi:hypothetical protein [Labilithrix luteola]|nr:hypothetical protein [Labilithrix luteola]